MWNGIHLQNVVLKFQAISAKTQVGVLLHPARCKPSKSFFLKYC